MTIQELCKEYEVPTHMTWLLDSAAANYESTRDEIISGLRQVERDSARMLAQAELHTDFWRDCRHLSNDTQRMSQSAAALEQIVNQAGTLIYLCAQEIMFNTVVNGEERSQQFKNAARSIIFGVHS